MPCPEEKKATCFFRRVKVLIMVFQPILYTHTHTEKRTRICVIQCASCDYCPCSLKNNDGKKKREKKRAAAGFVTCHQPSNPYVALCPGR